jgi:hypothetical protein
MAIEQIEALRYKVWMMGIAIDGPANVFCDNKAVFKTSFHLNQQLKRITTLLHIIKLVKRKLLALLELPGNQERLIVQIFSPNY